jgi:hypothetical protein
MCAIGKSILRLDIYFHDPIAMRVRQLSLTCLRLKTHAGDDANRKNVAAGRCKPHNKLE